MRQHLWMWFVNLVYGFPAITDNYSLEPGCQTSLRTFMPRLFRIATKVSEGVVNTQIPMLYALNIDWSLINIQDRCISDSVKYWIILWLNRISSSAGQIQRIVSRAYIKTINSLQSILDFSVSSRSLYFSNVVWAIALFRIGLQKDNQVSTAVNFSMARQGQM